VRLALAALLLLACGGAASSPKPATTGEALLAPWVAVRFGEPPGPSLAPPAYEPLGAEALLGATDERTVEITLAAGKVIQVAVEWRPAAADQAESAVRARLPPPRACAGAHKEIADFRPLLWRLPDGTAVSALRKGKLYRLTVSRPGSSVFDELYAACAAE
jgi:hypothetical protein